MRDNKKSNNRAKGKLGEEAALGHLVREGFREIERNYTRYTGEIDLILEKDSRVHFIEVKTHFSGNRSGSSGSIVPHETFHRPEDNVHTTKLRKIAKTVEIWLSEHKYQGSWQIDVVSVILRDGNGKASFEIIDNVILEQ